MCGRSRNGTIGGFTRRQNGYVDNSAHDHDDSAETTSTAVAASTTTAGQTTGGTVPTECLEAVQGYLQDVEPIVSEFDFDGGDIEAYLHLLMDQGGMFTDLEPAANMMWPTSTPRSHPGVASKPPAST